jgi:hypothetical protein
LIDVVYGVDSIHLPVKDLPKYSISFLRDPIENVKIQDQYEINGTLYNSNAHLTEFSAAQYIDYSNYCKEDPIKYEKVLSVFFIPAGHTYNDGYDINKVQ